LKFVSIVKEGLHVILLELFAAAALHECGVKIFSL